MGEQAMKGYHAASIRVCFCCPATYGRLAFRPSARAAHSPNLAVSNDRSRIRAHCGLDMSLGIRTRKTLLNLHFSAVWSGGGPLPASLRLIRFARMTALVADIWTIFCAVLIVGWQMIIFLREGSWHALAAIIRLQRTEIQPW